MELTGAVAPELLEADTPALSGDALGARAGFYLVGIIGGKDVGKSALVNALVGQNITAITSHGPGTETVIAYAHASQAAALEEMLEREVPGRFRIITHQADHLSRQVLLDLPDIDSHFQTHLEVTRMMLRHMLFPVWVQSIEKYADRQPQEMLRRVALGNAASNFVFCLNKVDQVEGSEAPGSGAGGTSAADTASSASISNPPTSQAAPSSPNSKLQTLNSPAREIAADFARRIERTLGLGTPPRVFMISATHPQRYDLPKLRELLTRQRSDESVRNSQQLAIRRQDQSLLVWLDAQNLSERARRLDRLHEEAQELLAARVGEPLLEEAIPDLLDDPANRLAMGDEILRKRVARWPLVNLVHTLLSPLLAVWRSNIGPAARHGLRAADALVDAHLELDGRALPARVQATFAQLRQSHPDIGELYRHNRLWEDLPSENAAAELRRSLAGAVGRQREAAVERLAGRRGILAPLFRWLLTIGALLWFPLVQPVLAGFLNDESLQINWYPDWRKLMALAVSVLSGEALLKNVTFLIIWFTVIWLALRWNTQRRLARLMERWKSVDYPDPSLNLAAQAMQWMRSLLDPIAAAGERMKSLAERTQALRERSSAEAEPAPRPTALSA